MGKTDPERPAPRAAVDGARADATRPASRTCARCRCSATRTAKVTASSMFDDVRVPRSNILGEEGGGFAMAQARLGPGRIHHCMRTIGAAERALEMLCRRVQTRTAFGKPLADQGVIQTWVADARIDIDQARLYTLLRRVAHGHAGQQGRPHRDLRHQGGRARRWRCGSSTTPSRRTAPPASATTSGSRRLYAHIRTLRLADGPDEVHRLTVARRELRKYAGSRRARRSRAPANLRSRRLRRTVPLGGRGEAMRKFLACSVVGIVVFGGALVACGGGAAAAGASRRSATR